MRVGVDLFSLNPSQADGVTTFSLGLVAGLLQAVRADGRANDRVVALISNENEAFLRDYFAGTGLEFYKMRQSILSRIVNRLLWIASWYGRNFRLRYWYEKFFRKNLGREIAWVADCLIVPNTVFNFFALDVPTVLCMHDIQQEYFPQNFTRKQRLLRWASYRLSCDRATAIQVSSRYIRDCLLEKFTFLSPDRIFIAPEGVDAQRFSFQSADQQPALFAAHEIGPFLFYPAQIWKHKNHELLMYALAAVRERLGREIPCILTGRDYGHWPVVEDLRRRLGLQAVHYLGRVEFTELVWLYKNCAAVLALGLHESSCLPVREGAAFGKPLICADIEPNLEAQDYLRVELFAQTDPNSLAQALLRLHDAGQEVAARANDNIDLIKNLEWSVIARKYLERLTA